MPQTVKRVMARNLFFTMGHSMVVVSGIVLVTAAAIALSRRFQQFEAVSGFVAIGTSTMVLLGIAIVNLAIFAQGWARFRQVYRRGTVTQRGIQASFQFQGPIYRHLQTFISTHGSSYSASVWAV